MRENRTNKQGFKGFTTNNGSLYVYARKHILILVCKAYTAKYLEVLIFMNKATFIAQLAEKSGLDRKQADKALEAFIETVTDALKAGDKVQLIGFGTFEVKNRAAHDGRNPATGKTIQIPASKSPVFKAGKTFKDAL